VSAAACDACLRRLHLVGILAPYIERVATGEPGSRSSELLRLDDEGLVRAVAPGKASALRERAGTADLGGLRDEIDGCGCWAVCRHDQGWPPGLRDAPDAPPALIGRGDPLLLARLEVERSVTVVGARRATAYGREAARSLALDLAGIGVAVVSGLAWGIDAAAHRGALEAAAPGREGITVAVLGCGSDVPYPRHHRRLHERIGAEGLVLSELPPGMTPWRWAFPARNRVMAALASMTVVVEAARRSGSLITAELAADLGREVGAVPGPIGARMSAGTNQLLADGASLVRDAQDVIDALFGPQGRTIERTGPALADAAGEVLDQVDAGRTDVDSIALALARSAGEVSSALIELEALGYLRGSFAGTYRRLALDRPECEAGPAPDP
jgi:DNA processing protein